MPVGLERHLFGTHRYRRCIAFGAAFWLCRDRVLAVPETSGHREVRRVGSWVPPGSGRTQFLSLRRRDLCTPTSPSRPPP
jgi:hypothetical protein